MVIFLIIITSLITAGLCYLVYHPKVKQRQEIDNDIIKQNIQLHEKYTILCQNAEKVEKEINEAQLEEAKYKERILVLQENTKTMEDQAEMLYQKNFSIAKEHFEQAMEKEGNNYQEQIKTYQKELEVAMLEGSQQFQEQMDMKKRQIDELNNKIFDLQAIVNSAVAAAKRKEEMLEKKDFYRIQLTPWEIDEVSLLREAGTHLKNIEPLNKVIWKCYYEKPTTDMIGRVIGSGIHTGIYKITNTENQKCYIGQAVDLANRWKQHIKRGVGAETPTRNKLYPAMYEIGPENFTFEVLEECENNLLNSREDYWQDFYKAKEFGYSIK